MNIYIYIYIYIYILKKKNVVMLVYKQGEDGNIKNAQRRIIEHYR